MINPISFGKIVRVKAPFHEAVRIANAINGAPTVSPKIQEQVKKIFDDTDKGHALAFSFNNDKDTCYIFSGKESREYLRALYQKALAVKEIKMTCSLEEALPKVLEAKRTLYDKTADLIKRTKEDFVLEIGENGSFINVIK